MTSGISEGQMRHAVDGGWRDVVNRTSFWDLPLTQQFAPLRGRMKADAAVIGGGLSGLTIALWLSRAGLKVALAEAETIGYGASSRCAGVVSLCGGRPFSAVETQCGMEETDKYAATMKCAFQSVRETAMAAHAGWQEMRAIVFGGDVEKLQKEAEACKRAGIAAQLNERKGESCLSVEKMGVLHTERYLQYLAQCSARLGAAVFEKSRVLSVEINEIRTASGVIQAPYIVVATGYPIINVPGWYFLRLSQKHSSLFLLSGDFSPESLWMETGRTYSLRPLVHGALLHWRGNEEDGEAIRKIALNAGMNWTGERWNGLEYCTPDGLPFIGPYGARTPNLFVTCGYEEKGILGSMLAAQAITARVLGLPSDGYEIYSGQRIRGSAAAALHMGGKYVRSIIRHPSAPRCPHMGCRLVYNRNNRLWECPCHGSMFDDIGHVLSAPAVQDAVLQGRRR